MTDGDRPGDEAVEAAKLVEAAREVLTMAEQIDLHDPMWDRLREALAGFSVDAGKREGYRLASLGTPPPTPEPDTAKLVDVAEWLNERASRYKADVFAVDEAVAMALRSAARDILSVPVSGTEPDR